MNGTVYREGCGTYLGLRLHVVNNEPICSFCLSEEDFRRLAHEGIPVRLSPPLAPITPEEGARNQAMLAATLRAIDKDRRAA